MQKVFKISTKATWTIDNFWSLHDRNSGFIHLSTRHQLRDVLYKNYEGQSGLVLVALNLSKLDNVKWEVAKNKQIYPRVYGDVNPDAFIWVRNLARIPIRGDTIPDDDYYKYIN